MNRSLRRCAIAATSAALFQLSITSGPATSPAVGAPSAAARPTQKATSTQATPKPTEVRADGYALQAPEGAPVVRLRKSAMSLEIDRAAEVREARLAPIIERLATTAPGPERDALQREAEEIKEAWELEVYAIQIAHARVSGRLATVRVLEAATLQLKAGQQARREAVRLAAERARGAR
jgi:hypothetical protein